MTVHGLPQDEICPWCLRRFAGRKAVEQHALRKHPRSYPRTEERIQRGALQAYHQERLKEGRVQ